MHFNQISIVIICKNSVNTIEKAIGSALLLSQDVVVVDSGSTDGTIEKIDATGVKCKQIEWNGYGVAKNIGNQIAENEWVLSLDADEYLDEELIASLKKVDLSGEHNTFYFKRLNYLGNKPIFFGAWGNDIVLRLFNKKNAYWDTSPVHEGLIIKNPGNKTRLSGVLHHFTSPDITTYKKKLKKYAELIADKYSKKGKKVSFLKLYISPVFNFFQYYFF